jgi:hypothetical protein
MNTPHTPIQTVEQLKEYLYVAMQLEHATIPPYLTAAYTAKIEANKDSIDAITAVAKEEMLHLTLTANLLNAIGGEPNLLRDGFVPKYPCHLPDGETDFEVSIVKFSDCAIDTFLKIERPSPPERPASEITKVRVQGDIKYIEKRDLRAATRGKGRGMLPHVTVENTLGQTLELHFWSIGEFYNAVRAGLKYLTAKLRQENLFVGKEDNQINPKYYFSAGGDLTRITTLDTALEAIELISVQGEGYTDETHGMSGELAHFYRFEQIAKGRYYQERDRPHEPSGGDFRRDYTAVYPIKKDAKVADYGAYPNIERQARHFNGRYRRFLQQLTLAFNGKPDLFATSYNDMFEIKREMEYLIRNPLSNTGENAAPTFEMKEFIEPSEEN